MKYLFNIILRQLTLYVCTKSISTIPSSVVISVDKMGDIQYVANESSNDNTAKLKDSIIERIDKLNKLDELNGWTMDIY